MKARISHVKRHDEDSRRLAALGLIEGTRFEVVKVAPMGDPVEISIRGYRLCLRRRETEFLEIETIP